MRKKIIICIAIICIPLIIAHAAKREKVLFDQGLETYLAGDINGAIAAFNECLTINPDFIDAKAALLKIHLEQGELLFEKRAYQLAKKEFESALQVSPDNTTAKKNIKIITDIIGNSQQSAKRDKQSIRILAEAQAQIALTALEDNMQHFMSMISNMKTSESYFINEIEFQRKETERTRMLLFQLGGLLLIIIIILTTVFIIIIRKIKTDQSKIISQEKVLSSLVNRMRTNQSDGYKDIDWHGVQFQKDFDFSKLEEDLSSSDYHRRMQAVKHLCRYDIEYALPVVSALLESENKFDTMVIFDILGQVGTIECFNLAVKYATPETLSDKRVRRTVRRTMQSFLDNTTLDLSEDQKKVLYSIIRS